MVDLNRLAKAATGDDSQSGLSQNGVAEISTSYEKGKKLIGTQDTQGNVIAIARIRRGPMNWVVYLFVLLGLMGLVFAKLYLQHPLSWASGLLSHAAVAQTIGDGNSEAAAGAVSEFALFSTGTWIAALITYVIASAGILFFRSMHRAMPGVDVYFAKYGEIYSKLSTGDKPKFIFDPRVYPLALVYTKIMVLEPEPTKGGRTKDSIPMTYTGVLVGRVTDSRILLTQGGFENFLARLNTQFSAVINNKMLQIDSKGFNQFMLEPMRIELATQEDDLTKRLERISTGSLDESMLDSISQISELDMSAVDVRESDTPMRHSILDQFPWATNEYGFTVSDHIPLAMSIPEENIATYLKTLSTTLQRLRQATDQLRATRQQEFDTELESRTKQQELVVIDIARLRLEMRSIIEILQDEEQRKLVIVGKEKSLENIANSVLTEFLTEIEAQMAQLDALSVNAAGLEAFLSETDRIYKELEADIGHYFPSIGTVLCERAGVASMLPTSEALDALMQSTGTAELLAKLEAAGTNTSELATRLTLVDKIVEGTSHGDATQVDPMARVSALVEKITQDIGRIPDDPGVSIAGYSQVDVEERLNAIARQHNTQRSRSADSDDHGHLAVVAA